MLNILSSSWNAGLLQADSFFRRNTKLPADFIFWFVFFWSETFWTVCPFPSLCCSFQLSNCYNRQWMVKFLDMLKRSFPFDKHLKSNIGKNLATCPIQFLCKTQIFLESHYLNLIYLWLLCPFLNHSRSLNTITKFILCFSIFKTHSRWKCNWILILTLYFSQAGINFHKLNLYQKP